MSRSTPDFDNDLKAWINHYLPYKPQNGRHSARALGFKIAQMIKELDKRLEELEAAQILNSGTDPATTIEQDENANSNECKIFKS